MLNPFGASVARGAAGGGHEHRATLAVWSSEPREIFDEILTSLVTT